MSEADRGGEKIRRFLYPTHAIDRFDPGAWQVWGEADTPGADARCRIGVVLDAHGIHIEYIGFSVFGPSVAVACADWACERLTQRAVVEARALTVGDFERPLALAPDERYAALLVVDALANALCNLGT